MKAGTLIYATIVMGVLLLQDTANGGKTVSKKKMEKWSNNNDTLNNEKINIEAVDVKNNPELAEQGKEIEDLIEVIQFVVTDSFNNDEFRTFMIKRFLHNYLPQVTEYLKKVKKIKKEIDPKSTDEDDKKFEAMKSQ